MRISHTVIIPFLILFVYTTISHAQLVKVGVGGGITQVLAPNYFTDEKGGYGYSTEWNAGLIAKIDIPLIPITPRGYFFYHSLTGNGEFDPGFYNETNVEFKQNILEIGVGAQYNFIATPLGFDPYFALDIGYSNIGKLSANGSEDIPLNEAISRFGGGVGIGTEVSIVPVVNLDLYLSYKMLNLIGKEDGEETISAVTLDAFIIFNFL